MDIRFAFSFKSSVEYLIIRNAQTPERIFGRFERRSNYTKEQAFELFMGEWENGMKAAVEDAIEKSSNIEYDAAKSLIQEHELPYLNRNKEHRSFKYKNFPFVVQLTHLDQTTCEIDQVWFIHSHDFDRLLVCVRFETKEEKDKFEELAKREGHSSGREFLAQFVKDFMDKNSQT